MTFDLAQFTENIKTLERNDLRTIRQALRDEETRRDALPFVAERENEIAEEWQESHPPVVDEATGLPVWVQPAGAHDAWPINAIVVFEGEQWQNIHPAPNAWKPGELHGQWMQLTYPEPEPEPDAPEHPVWVQPTGAHDTYPPQATVTHNGTVWINQHNAGNSWEPGTTSSQWEEIPA